MRKGYVISIILLLFWTMITFGNYSKDLSSLGLILNTSALLIFLALLIMIIKKEKPTLTLTVSLDLFLIIVVILWLVSLGQSMKEAILSSASLILYVYSAFSILLSVISWKEKKQESAPRNLSVKRSDWFSSLGFLLVLLIGVILLLIGQGRTFHQAIVSPIALFLSLCLIIDGILCLWLQATRWRLK